MRGARLIAAAVTTLVALALSLLLAPDVAHAWEVKIAIRGAGQVTETTTANLVGSGCFSSNTTPTGTISKNCTAGSTTGDYASGWIVEYAAQAKPGYRFVQWQNNNNSTYPSVLCDGSNGSAIYTGSTCRFQIFQNLQTEAVFEDVTKPLAPAITGMSPSSGFTNGYMFFTFTRPPNDPTVDASNGFECRIREISFNWQRCSSGQGFNPPEGTYTFDVRSVDASGNRSDSYDTETFTVDKTPPNTTLEPTVGPAPGSTVESGDALFAFSSSEPTNATFECNLTGPGLTSTIFTLCNPSPSQATTKSYTNLKDGSYTFKVRAKDQAGNVDTTYDTSTRTWTVRNSPTVIESSLSPARNLTGVSRTTNVSATFSEEMKVDTLTSATFKLQMYNKKKKKWVSIPATITLDNTNRTATLDPYGATEPPEPSDTEQSLAANKKFRGLITTGAKDAAGNPLARSFTWIFYTGSS